MPSQPTSPPLVVMGVSGSGKSTVGAAIAGRLRVPFADADDFHPAANIAKMSAGHALDDDDRYPWLETIGEWLADHLDGGVMSCSALKRSYRDQLRKHCPQRRFLHLHGSPRGDRAPSGQPTRPLHARLAARLPVRHPRAARTRRGGRRTRRRPEPSTAIVEDYLEPLPHRGELMHPLTTAVLAADAELPSPSPAGGSSSSPRCVAIAVIVVLIIGGEAAPVPGPDPRRPDRRHRGGREHQRRHDSRSPPDSVHRRRRRHPDRARRDVRQAARRLRRCRRDRRHHRRARAHRACCRGRWRCVGAIIGLPMFFEIGLVLLMPVIYLVARRAQLSADHHRHPGAGRPVRDARSRAAAPRSAHRDRLPGRRPRRHPGARCARRRADRRSSPGPLFGKLAGRWVNVPRAAHRSTRAAFAKRR